MRKTALVLVLGAAACGGGHGKKDGGTGKDDAHVYMDAPGPDAPALIACTPKNGTTVSVRQIGRVSGGAVLATSPPNDGRLFVLEQGGRIRIFQNEQLVTTPFLDLTAVPNTGFAADAPPGERGLLGLAFSPSYAYDRTFYIFYTTANPAANVVERFTASATDPNVADPASGVVILSIPDFATNHNGGMMEFNPKDTEPYLYIGTGDGGGAGDPQRNGQDLNKLLGKILRIDPRTEENGKKYAIPPTNPFAAGGGAPEIWMYGVRNPWRWSFDTATGDMWIGDVGQGAYEELDVIKYGQQAGKNLGWSKFEGNHCYGNYTPCADTDVNTGGFTGPVYERTHSENPAWLAIIGGQVYNGTCFPDLVGTYFTVDYNAHRLASGKLQSDGSVNMADLPVPTNGWPQTPSSIHADARGELFMTTTGGFVYQIEAGP